ncbi:MAG: hypothetical protein GF411_00520 [Candidatus Lokiarchaeota archaeon]|nr:hypothetical protein [Candidatus Lokiarchaeota archaeon]
MRVKRTVTIAMSNYEEIVGACAFTYDGRIGYATDNLNLASDIVTILSAWNGKINSYKIKNISFITAMTTENGLVAINPDGAVALMVGTGKGIWFVAAMAPMDKDKMGILMECVTSAKNLERSISVYDIPDGSGGHWQA